MAVAKELIEDWERIAKGLKPKSRGRHRLDDALNEFEKFLRGRRGKQKQRRKLMRQLREVIREARGVAALDFVDELSDEVYQDWLTYAEARNLANRTINERVRILLRFGKWLRAKDHLVHDPFEILDVLPDREDLRQLRRALWRDESQALSRSALRRQIEEELARNAASITTLTPGVAKNRRKRLSNLRRVGYYRALVYYTCLRTGLRRDEARKIRISDVQFDRRRIRISPEACKVKVEQFVQMDGDLARHLRSYVRRLGSVSRAQPLFGFIKMVRKAGAKKAEPTQYSWVPGMRSFDRDLAHAGIQKKDETDRVVVFHSLRKTFITYLWMDDENRPQDIQRLARHSDLKLTQQVYTDWEMLAGREWAAAERLAGWLRE